MGGRFALSLWLLLGCSSTVTPTRAHDDVADSGRAETAVDDARPFDVQREDSAVRRDATHDFGVTNDLVNDLSPTDDVPTDDVRLDASTVVDTGWEGGLRDVLTVPPDADVCTDFALPRDTAALRVLSALDAPLRDATFDDQGRVVIAHGDRITAFDHDGTPTVLYGYPPVPITAIRYTRTGSLIVAYNVETTGGRPQGRVAFLRPGFPALFLLPGTETTGRVGGLAVDRSDAIWYTDLVHHRLHRVRIASANDPTPVYTFACGDAGSRLCNPSAIAFDVDERALFVAASDSTGQGVYRLPITRADGGDGVIVGSPTPVLLGLPSVTGLAVDECNNVYIADEHGRAIYRLSESGSNLATLTRNIPSPRGLAFGTGGMFDSRVLFSLSASTAPGLYATQSVARGDGFFNP